MSIATGASLDDNLTAKLRRATAEAHATIESRLDLFKPGLTLARYAELLQRWLAFYAAWEPAAARWFASHGEFFPLRSKIEYLQRDLAACGYEPRHIPCDLGPIEPTDYPTALGTLYVTEGSTLGGQLVAPQVCALLPLTPADGAAFYSAYGSQTGLRWRETKDLLNQAPPEMHARVIEAATATFTWLGAWLTEDSSK